MNQRELLIISITIFCTVIGWIIADLAHVARTEQLPENDPRFSKPITVTIDMSIFGELEKRK
jgi:hypothetical protein